LEKTVRRAVVNDESGKLSQRKEAEGGKRNVRSHTHTTFPVKQVEREGPGDVFDGNY